MSCRTGFPDATLRRLLVDNALETYPRLRDNAAAGTNSAANQETVP